MIFVFHQFVFKIIQKIKKIQPDDKASLLKIASTSMQSKLISEDSSSLSKIVVDAILSIATKKGDQYFVDLENIKVEKLKKDKVKKVVQKKANKSVKVVALTKS